MGRAMLPLIARVGRALAAVAAGILILPAVLAPLGLRAQGLLGLALVLVALGLARARGERTRLGLILLSVMVSSRYLWWRATTTLTAEASADAVLGAVLFVAELYAYVMLLLGYFQQLAPLRRQPVPLPAARATWPSVDVFIPTYDEPLAVVRATVRAAQAMDWPAEKLHVYLLDDGRRPEFRAFAASVGVSYLTRADNRHAKAGNLNHALGRSRGELVAIFDCDHVPTRAFLQLTVGLLVRDPRLAVVQTPHHFYSSDPFERNLGTAGRLPGEGELFYGLIQPGNDLWDAAFFCGSCAVLRRSALAEVGGVAVETVTEDAHTMLRLHRRGYSSAFVDIPLAAGLATESLAAHVGQRIRWARGMAQIFRIDNPLLGRGLRWPQRLCYASSMLHFFFGVPRIIFLLSPLSFLLFGARIFNAVPLLVLAYSLPHLLLSLLASSRLQRAFRHSFWSEVYETVLSVYVAIPTTLALLAPHRGRFNVTAKGGVIERRFFARRIALPYLVLAALNLVGLVAGIARVWLWPGRDTDVVAMNLTWTVYNLAILGAALAVAWEQRQTRAAPRVPLVVPAMLRLPGGHAVRCATRDLSMVGAALTLRREPPLPPGEHLQLSLFSARGERVVPAIVVQHAGSLLRLRWTALPPGVEAGLVEALFGRADAWVARPARRKDDFVLRSFKDVAGHALRAFGRTVAGRW
jgi:cellulose synthase (UDP-forming)